MKSLISFFKKQQLIIKIILITFVLSIAINIYLYAAEGDIPFIFNAGDQISASEINGNFQALLNKIKANQDRMQKLETMFGPDNPPAGTIFAYAGENIPDGYFLCDGRELNKENHPKLFNAIGTKWGGDGFPYFRIPDLRGRFLRGVDHGEGRDVDAATRRSFDDKAKLGDVVGSYQEDAFQIHKHIAHTDVRNDDFVITDTGEILGIKVGTRNDVFYMTHNNATDQDFIGDPKNGSRSTETRPINAAVNFIIKY